MSGEPEATGAVVTEGVTSAVIEAGATVGHITLLDYDDGLQFGQVVDEAADLGDGLTAIFESSPGSFHVWHLGVREADRVALSMLSSHADPAHAATGWRHEPTRWVVRFGPKREVLSDGAKRHYKDRPAVRAAWYDPTDEPHSGPHMDLLESLSEETAAAVGAAREDEVPEVGDDLTVTQYMTGTDAQKERWRSGPSEAPLPAYDGGR